MKGKSELERALANHLSSKQLELRSVENPHNSIIKKRNNIKGDSLNKVYK